MGVIDNFNLHRSNLSKISLFFILTSAVIGLITVSPLFAAGDGNLLKRSQEETCHACHKTNVNTPSPGTTGYVVSDWDNTIKMHSGETIGTCSNSTYKTRTACVNNSGTWTPTKWAGLGGWGVPSGRYGEFGCTTCHTAHDTVNIYLIKEAVTAPGSPAFPGSTVDFRTTGAGTGSMGDDTGGHTSSARVCEVCHTFDGTGANGLKYHGYAMASDAGHNNNTNCASCHGHKLAFASCRACHPQIVPGTNHHGVSVLCTTCHGIDHGAAPPNPADNAFCLTCHTQSGSNSSHHAVTGVAACNSCHVIPGVTVPPSTNANCLACHSGAMGTFGAITPGVNHHGSTQNCTVCHTAEPFVPLPDTTDPTCTACHAERVSTMNHPQVAPMFTSLTCAQCHAIPGTSYPGHKPGIEVCAQCHGPFEVWPLTDVALTARVDGMHQMTPDLVIGGIFVTPTTVATGGSVSVTDFTSNMSVGGTAGASTTGYYVQTACTNMPSGSPVATKAVSSLGPGASSPSSPATSVPMGSTPGTFYIVAKADYLNVVDEGTSPTAGENNNTRCSDPITVMGASPDLVVAAVAAPASATHGNSISVSDRTQNIGTVLAAASKTAVYIKSGTTCPATVAGATPVNAPGRSVPSLIATGSSTATYNVTIPVGATLGANQLIWNADDGGVVGESNEGNNIKCKAINVL